MYEGNISTVIDGFELRFAKEADCPLILDFIRSLAEYEKMADQVVATAEDLRDSLFAKKQADVLIGEYAGKPVAFAVVYYPYSTFIGGVYLYLEDLFVMPEYRGHGFGKEVLRCLAGIAVKRGYRRMEWWCLDWNESAASFYKKFGAKPMDMWTTFRLDKDALAKAAFPADRV